MFVETPVVSLVMLTAVALAYQVKPNGRSSIPLFDLLNRNRESTTAEPVWTGKYFPGPPASQTTPSPVVTHSNVPMSSSNPECDDGKSNLTLDWDLSPVDYTCYHPNQRIVPDFDTQPKLQIDPVPKMYSAYHYCMNDSITFLNPIPTFGPHRPVWPRYGEYKYVPAHRWLHTLEHGGVVMLYHPCAHPLEIGRLRYLVKSCLFRHVISPNRHLSPERPLALLTWGKLLTMSAVNVDVVRDFIMQNALQGPEKISRDGQYDLMLLNEAEIVSDSEDTDLCPAQKLNMLSLFW